MSDELAELLAGLTAKQRAAIPVLVQTLAEGGSVQRLLRGGPRRANKPAAGEGICNWTTFYRKRRGWAHNPQFQQALEQARKEYDQAVLRSSVQDAAERLRRAAPKSVEAAEAIVDALLRGDGEAGILSPIETLLRISGQGETKRGQVKAALGLVGQGLRAALSILDRADIETAVKQQSGDEARWASLLQDLRGLEDEDDLEGGEEEGTNGDV